MGNYARVGLAGVGVTCGVLLLAVTLVDNNDNDHTSTTTSASSSKGPYLNGSSTSAPPNDSYVALGDSYTAGAGIPPETGTPAGCDRSGSNYPALVADELGIKSADFHDVSCSGATLADLSGSQSTKSGVNAAQFKALSSSTDLVTIGMGGNDIGFASLVKQCVKAGAFYYATGSGKFTGNDAPCKGRYVDGGTDEIRQKIDKAGEKLADTLAEVKRRAPEARVYVVGYPAILPAKGDTCEDDMTIAPEDLAFLNEKEQQLNSTLRQRAVAAGAGYVDTYKPSEGLDACSARETRWVEPLLPQSPAAPVHPNEHGERGMADAVVNALKSS